VSTWFRVACHDDACAPLSRGAVPGIVMNGKRIQRATEGVRQREQALETHAERTRDSLPDGIADD
jgi:hypothetical protein